MSNRFSRRRRLIAALIGVVSLIGAVALSQVMRPKDDPRLYGMWRLGKRGSPITLGPGGQGHLTGFPTEPLSWSVHDSKFYLSIQPRSLTEGLSLWIDKRLGGGKPSLKVFTIVEIRQDVVVLRKQDGQEFQMTREKAIATPAEGGITFESQVE